MEDVTTVQLYPETDEPVNIVNIKRGIVSALVVPVMEDEQNSLMVGVSSQHNMVLQTTSQNGRRCFPSLSYTQI